MYGVDEPETAFGRQCLLARGLVENGVRFVQIFSGGWDSHDYLKQGHTSRIKALINRWLVPRFETTWTLKIRLLFGQVNLAEHQTTINAGVYSRKRPQQQGDDNVICRGWRKASVVGATDEPRLLLQNAFTLFETCT